MMKKFLLAMSTTVQSSELVETALDFVKEKEAELVVVFVLDSQVPEAIFSQLTDIGFTGEKLSGQLKEAVNQEYQHQANEILTEIKERAKQKKVNCQVAVKEGNFTDKVLEAVGEYQPDLLILSRVRQTFLTRLFSRSAMDELLRRAPCEIKVFES